MSSLKRRIENIKIDDKDYVMAFDMTSIDMFQDLTGSSVLRSVYSLNRLEDKTVLAFIASTLRPKEDIENPIGKQLYEGEYDLLKLMIMFIPTLVKLINEGFPTSNKKVKKKKSMKNQQIQIGFFIYIQQSQEKVKKNFGVAH